jgi:hypothetical protein
LPDLKFVQTAITAQNAVRRFHTEEDAVSFRVSVHIAKQLDDTIQSVLEMVSKPEFLGTGQLLDAFSAMYRLLTEFEIILNRELSDLPLYSVEEKGNLSRLKLINGASAGYSAGTLAKLSSRIIEEIDESGRCLAFNRPTACGFHILRALELSTSAYIVANLGAAKLPPQNRCNWGAYIDVLRTGRAPKEITDLLQIIKDDYRNPIMHPEEILAPEEAANLFCVCQSAIEVLYR